MSYEMKLFGPLELIFFEKVQGTNGVPPWERAGGSCPRLGDRSAPRSAGRLCPLQTRAGVVAARPVQRPRGCPPGFARARGGEGSPRTRLRRLSFLSFPALSLRILEFFSPGRRCPPGPSGPHARQGASSIRSLPERAGGAFSACARGGSTATGTGGGSVPGGCGEPRFVSRDRWEVSSFSRPHPSPSRCSRKSPELKVKKLRPRKVLAAIVVLSDFQFFEDHCNSQVDPAFGICQSHFGSSRGSTIGTGLLGLCGIQDPEAVLNTR
nr:uncharacterized protein LOC123288222 [Equus asinus]